jgi:hypothetical protein
MEEILYGLVDLSLGLNFGILDYAPSIFCKFSVYEECDGL